MIITKSTVTLAKTHKTNKNKTLGRTNMVLILTEAAEKKKDTEK